MKKLIQKWWSWNEFTNKVSSDNKVFDMARQMCQAGELGGLRYAYINHLLGKKAKERILKSIEN